MKKGLRREKMGVRETREISQGRDVGVWGSVHENGDSVGWGVGGESRSTAHLNKSRGHYLRVQRGRSLLRKMRREEWAGQGHLETFVRNWQLGLSFPLKSIFSSAC